MLENVVVALAIFLAIVFLVRNAVKTYRRGGCSGCCDRQKGATCSCCSACLRASEEDVKKG